MTSGSQKQANDATTLALVLIVPFLFAINNVGARMAAGIVPPVALAFWRWALAALLLLPVVGTGLWRKRDSLCEEWPHIAALGLLGMCIVSIATFWGGQRTQSANIGLIYSATPALILLFDRLASPSRLTIHQIAGLVACVSGTVWIVAKGDAGNLLNARFSNGDLVIAAGTVGWAAYSVLLKFWPTRLTVVERACVIALAGAIFTLPLYLGEHLYIEAFVPDMLGLGIIAAVGILSGALLIVLHAETTARLGPRRAVVLLYLIPIYNIALAWAVIGEALQLYQAIGATFVMLGVYLTTRPPPRAITVPE